MLEKMIIDPKETIPVEDGKAGEKLIDIARAGDLGKRCGYAPVIEAPKNYQHLGKYILLNGHHRRDAAIQAGVRFPVVVVKIGNGKIKDIAEDLGEFQEITEREYKGCMETALECLNYASKRISYIFSQS